MRTIGMRASPARSIVCQIRTFSILLSLKMKKSLFPCGEQGQKVSFCGTTLFAG